MDFHLISLGAGAPRARGPNILEDLAGIQIGRALEIDHFDAVDKGPEPKTILIPFTAR